MSVTSAQAVTLLENVLFESPTVANANAAAWVYSSSNGSSATVASMAQAMAATPEAGIVQQVVRYYMGALGRVPGGVEIQYYVNLVETGLTPSQIMQGASAVAGSEWAQIAAYFAASPEFASDFGLSTAGQIAGANEAQVVALFYNNILGRLPSLAEIAYYENLLNTGTSLSTLIQYFTESPEYQTSVDANIDSAVANYGTSVANGTTPATIPFAPINLTLGASNLTVTGLLNTSAVVVTGTPATAARTGQTAVTGVIPVTGVTAATGVTGVTAVAGVTPVAGQSAVTAVTDGSVTINDASSGTTGAGSIKSVTLADSGAGSVINDNALTSLSLIGTTGTLAITNLNTAAIAAHSSVLALTLNGLSAANNTITDTNSEISTLTVTTATADSVLAGFADAHLTVLTVAGTNKLTLETINNSLTSFTLSGGASFNDGATSHAGGFAALGAQLATITDTSTGTFTAALDDTTQSFVGGVGTATIMVSALADATKTINAGSAKSGNELIFEGGGYALTSASSGKFVGFQTVGVAADVTGTIDLSVIDSTASTIEVIGASAGITFVKAATGTSLLLDPSSGATVTVGYADSAGAKDSATVTLSSAVTSLTLQDALGVGIGTVTIIDTLAATDTNVTPAYGVGALIDNGLATLNVSGNGGLSIASLTDASAAAFTLNNSSTNGYGVTIGTLADAALTTLTFMGTGVSTITNLAPTGASFAVANKGSVLDYIGTITDANLTSLTLGANVALGQASTALTTNGLQDNSAAGVTVSGGADNAHVTINLTAGASATATDTITLGNGNNVVVDASLAGTVTVKLGSGANLVELGGAGLDTTAKYSVTFAARTATPPNAIFVGAAGTNYATLPNLVITGASTGDIIAFGNDSQSSSTALTATSLTSASSVASALSLLEAVTNTAHEVAYGVYGGNTYIVESASGMVSATDTTVVEIIGSETLTAAAGSVTIGSAASTLSTGSGLSGASFTLQAGTPTSLSLETGANVVTLIDASASVVDTFTSLASSSSLVINYQATSGTDTIQMSGSAGANASDITSLTVNDTSTASAGVTIGAFTDNGLTGVTYNNSAAVDGATVTQQTLTSSSLTAISFTGGVSGKTSNNYFFTGVLTTTGALTITDSNIGTGTVSMGLTLSGGPSLLALSMTSPGVLAVGTVSDNNLAAITIAGSGTGQATVGSLTDTIASAFTVTDTSTSTGGSIIALNGLSAATSLTVNDSATGALTDSSAYSDSSLTSLTLKNTAAGALTIGGAGITASALSSVTLTGSGTGTMTIGQLDITGSGSLVIVDSSASTGGITLPVAGITGLTSLSVVDTAAGALSLGAFTGDSNLTSLSLSNTGSAVMSLGAVLVDGLTSFTIAQGGTGTITFASITDTVAGAFAVTDNSTTASATSLTFASVPNATSFTVNDNAKGLLTVGSLTDNDAVNLAFNNTSTALLSATIIDNASTVTLTLGGSGTATEAIALTDSAGGTLTIDDTGTSTGASTVTPTLTNGGAPESTITMVTINNTSKGLLTVGTIASDADAVLTTFDLGGSGAITTGFSAPGDTSGTVTITDSDSGVVNLTSIAMGSPGATGSLVIQTTSAAGNLTLSSVAGYITSLTLDNEGSGTLTSSFNEVGSLTTTVTLKGTGAQVIALSDTGGTMNITQMGASINTSLTFTHDGQTGDSVTLGNGFNSLVLNDATLTDTITVSLGTGTNAITLTSGHTGANTINLAAASASNTNNTAVTADSITNFLLDTGAAMGDTGDTLSVGTTTILSGTTVPHWTISAAGMMTNTGATVQNFIAAVQAATSAGVAGFLDTSGNSWIAYTDGSHNVGVIELVGTSVLGLDVGTLATGYVHLT